MSDPASLLRTGDLPGLRALFAARVRAEPGRAAHRVDLADVLIVAGELERADALLDAATVQDPAIALPVALTRQLIRAATAREDCFAARRPPELVAEADEGLVAALARLAGTDASGAVAGELAGTIDGRRFEGVRDGDDRLAEVLEVLTSTGKYVWVSLAQVASLKPLPPARLRDVAWRQAELEVRGGPGGVVYLPAIYPGAATDPQRLGRETDWMEVDGAVRGMGLRTFLVGEDAVTFDDFAELAVDA